MTDRYSALWDTVAANKENAVQLLRIATWTTILPVSVLMPVQTIHKAQQLLLLAADFRPQHPIRRHHQHTAAGVGILPRTITPADRPP